MFTPQSLNKFLVQLADGAAFYQARAALPHSTGGGRRSIFTQPPARQLFQREREWLARGTKPDSRESQRRARQIAAGTLRVSP